MMQPIVRGRYRARLSDGSDDLQAAQRLRWLCFYQRIAEPAPPDGVAGQSGQDRDPNRDGSARNGASQDGSGSGPLDQDDLDGQCLHLLVEDLQTGDLVSCCRLLPLVDGSQIQRSYSAQFYDLSALAGFDGPMLEIGRFCIHPDRADPDILRIAWAALTQFVATNDVQMLFGCSSFIGCEPEPHTPAFAILARNHLAPKRWWPRVKAPRIFRFARLRRAAGGDGRAGLMAMPPLLRSYLAMGGWVSDHAVVDTTLRTMHVFTGLEVGAIPAARRRLLVALAG
ncbi:MAG: GNAT family N-acyltransferase [Paracoccus sp. (in: a-proteobacteria)]|nr:GNAT family N-acyltransferase [Paracoccus sp. (in: a-proteobacteria)]